MLDAAQRMQSLLKGLLEYSKVTTKADPFVEVELAEIVGEVLCDLEIKIKRTGAEVRVLELPVVKADPTQMRQLFQNLIANALKFHKEDDKPAIEVSSAVAEGKLRIMVKDNGIGFEEKHLERISPRLKGFTAEAAGMRERHGPCHLQEDSSETWRKHYREKYAWTGDNVYYHAALKTT